MSRIPLFLLVLAIACSDDDAPGDTDGGAGSDASIDGGGGRAGASGRAGGSGGRAGASGSRPDAGGARPTRFVLEGSATGSPDDDMDAGADRRVECSISGVLEMLEYEANGDFEGVFLGEIFRTAHIGDMAFEFKPSVGGPASLRRTSGDGVELRFVGDQPANALQFWQQLEVVTGTETGENRYGGEWQCAPGLLTEPNFPDIDLTVAGEWMLRPQ